MRGVSLLMEMGSESGAGKSIVCGSTWRADEIDTKCNTDSLETEYIHGRHFVIVILIKSCKPFIPCQSYRLHPTRYLFPIDLSLHTLKPQQKPITLRSSSVSVDLLNSLVIDNVCGKTRVDGSRNQFHFYQAPEDQHLVAMPDRGWSKNIPCTAK